MASLEATDGIRQADGVMDAEKDDRQQHEIIEQIRQVTVNGGSKVRLTKRLTDGRIA